MRIIPDMLIAGNDNAANGTTSGLLGLKLMEDISKKNGKYNAGEACGSGLY